jgi:hypothetical protein
MSAAEARKTGLELAPRLEDHLASAIWAAAERMEAEQRLAESDYEEARKAFDAVFVRAAEDIKRGRRGHGGRRQGVPRRRRVDRSHQRPVPGPLAVLLMSDRIKAFDFAIDTSKQLLTLATGIIALTVTFARDVTGDTSGCADLLLAIAWGLYILSIVAGVGTLMTLTGNLERPQSADASIYAGNIKFFAGCQVGTFLLGIVLTVAFGVVAL